MKDRPILCCSDDYEEPFPIHEKYNLQDALSNKLHGKDVAIIKAQRLLREDEEYRPASLLTSTLDEGWATHQGTNFKVLPWGILQQAGRTSRIRKVTDEHHILVWFPGACLQRPIRKVSVRQNSTTLETWVRTPYWHMGEDTFLYLLTWVRTPYQRSGWGHPLGSLGEDTPPETPFLG